MLRTLPHLFTTLLLTLGLVRPPALLAQDGEEPTAMVQLGIRNMDGSLSDETVLDLEAGAPGQDVLDVPKFDDDGVPPLYIATLAPNGEPLTYNAYGPYSTELAVLVQLQASQSGIHTITVMGLGSLPGTTCVALMDLVTGETTILHEDQEINVELPAGVPSGPQYKLLVKLPTVVAVTDACPGSANGTALVTGSGNGPWDVTWSNSDGQPIATQSAQQGPVGQGDLAPGAWTAVVTDQGGCGTFTVPFVVNESTPLTTQATSEPSSCASDSSDGLIHLEVAGGTAPYTFQWSNGTTGQDLMNVSSGTYHVTVTDANGCTDTFEGLVVEQQAPIAGGIVAPGTANTDEPIQFNSDAGQDVQRTWHFGDGSGSTQPSPVHAYQFSGTYTVTLIMNQGNCQTVDQQNIVVSQSSVGLAEVSDDEVHAWSGTGLITIVNPLHADLHVHVYDATGRIVHTGRVNARTQRNELRTDAWTKGLYFLNASTPWAQWTFSLVVGE